MKTAVKFPFQVSMSFKVDDDTGYLVTQLGTPERPAHVAYEKDFGKELLIGEVLEVEFSFVAGKQKAPVWMIPVFVGNPTLPKIEHLQTLYLSHLYNLGLRSNHANKSTPRSFDPDVVFSIKELRLLEELYNTMTQKQLRPILAATDFTFSRKSVYTRFDGGETSYHTPRLLKYYPKERIVSARFALGGGPGNFVTTETPEPNDVIPSSQIQSMVIRTTKDEGWMSLRDYMKLDPKVNAFVRNFYADGHAFSKEMIGVK